MRNIKVVVAMAFFAFSVVYSEPKAEESGSQQEFPMQVQQENAALGAEDNQVKQNPRLEDFVGKWVGKWDDIFYVQFTITPLDDDEESLTVVYEWEERVGQELQRSVRAGKIEGNILKVGKIDISLLTGDEDQGKAYGHFPRPRTANLTREKPKE